jgi:hypothetical protein
VRVAREIVWAINRSSWARSDLDEHQGRIVKAFETAGIERWPAEQIAAEIVDLIRQQPT